MKLSTREDIDAPIAFVFDQMSDFQRFERRAVRRGAEVRRADPDRAAGPGLIWNVRFEYRGRMQDVTSMLTVYEPPETMRVDSQATGLSITLDVLLIALAQKRTRAQIGIDVRPTTLSGRLMVQSLKFAKSNLSRRFTRRVATFGEEIADRYAAGG